MSYLWRFLTATPLSILLYRIATYPYPLRVGLARLWLMLNPRSRPHYHICLREAAQLARVVGEKAISVIEFGVARGNGLRAIERYAEQIERKLGVRIEIYGFDMGDQVGLPQTVDPRDMPYLWAEGHYKMDWAALKARLKRAELRFGDVAETVPAFVTENFAPVGVVFVDVDYYTSTCAVLSLFDEARGRTLPRVVCYFDDVDVANPYTGELAAIAEFNETHPDVKIARVDSHHTAALYGTFAPHVFHLHDFAHPKYNTFVPGVTAVEL